MTERVALEIETPETPAEASATPLTHEQIAALAKILWAERGCPEGSPEVDWFQAEQELREKQQA
ncbi:MAG: DUF2934 domain-containing protein [Bryobacteraceae bacterium]